MEKKLGCDPKFSKKPTCLFVPKSHACHQQTIMLLSTTCHDEIFRPPIHTNQTIFKLGEIVSIFSMSNVPRIGTILNYDDKTKHLLVKIDTNDDITLNTSSTNIENITTVNKVEFAFILHADFVQGYILPSFYDFETTIEYLKHKYR